MSMGLLDFILGRDATDPWPPAKCFNVSLDLRNHALNGISLDKDVSALQSLGRPDNRHPVRSGCFTYGLSGAQFVLLDGRINYFAIAVADDPRESLRAAKAQIIGPDGRTLKLSGQTTLDDVRALVAVDPATDIDDEEIVATYPVGRFTLEVEATLSGHVKRVSYWET
ncbi:MAG: hypothetical protein GXY74_00170 [Phycisphaerae bacterium]|nr:hypothetical protein [Phycisphaerae bacterium]